MVLYVCPRLFIAPVRSVIVQDVGRLHAAGLASMAYYYFDFRDVKKQDCYGLLSPLVLQLSADSDSCYNILSRLYSDNINGTREFGIDVLKECMKGMLNLPGKCPIYIIVDALDECPDLSGTPTAREEVSELIGELVELKLLNVHLCVARWPELDIQLILDPSTTKFSLRDDTRQKEDIVKYIKSVVYSDRNMRRWKEDDKQLVVVTLPDKADGMQVTLYSYLVLSFTIDAKWSRRFRRWVVCQLDRLRRTFPISIRKVLNDLPKTLDETYDRTLLNIDEEKRESAQRLFRCLAVCIRPLRVDELAEILAIQFDEVAPPTFNTAWRLEEAVVSASFSLIAIVDKGGHQVVQSSHFSVKEYLTSERLKTADSGLSYYQILSESAHTTPAHAGLSVPLQLDDRIDKDTICHLSLALYAARHWVDHAKFDGMSSHIQDAMKRLFDPAKSHLPRGSGYTTSTIFGLGACP